MEKVYDMIIIGGGPGGYAAALYAARSGFQTLVLEKESVGGQMAQAHWIDNYPGFEEGIDGFSLAQKMQQGAERFGVETLLEEVTAVELCQPVKEVRTEQGVYRGKTVVFATGASPRKLELPGEEDLRGRGLSYCAACDGMFFRGKTVVVVGGGNSAAADAVLLSRVAERVILVHRRDTLRATKLDQDALKNAPNVEFRWNSVVTELLYEERITGVMLKDVKSGQEQRLPCDGVFVSIGRKPAAELVQGQLELDEGGYVVAGEDTKTAIAGVFAVGDVRKKQLRQVVTAVADGAAAVRSAEQYLTE